MVKFFYALGIAVAVFVCHCGYASENSVVGDEYFEDGKWDKAVDEYENLLSKNKNQPEILYKLGNAYCKKGELEKAVEAFNKATQLKPDYADAYQRMSEVSMQLEVPADDLKDCIGNVQKDPNNTNAHMKLGMTYYKRNLFDEAKREYETVIGLDPKNTDAYFNLGVLHQDFGSHDKAVEMYKKAVEFSPNHDKAHFNLGIAFYQTGHLEASVSEYKRVIEINPRYTDAYVNLGIVYFVKGDYKSALVVLKKALSFGSNTAKVHYYLGNVYYKMDKTDKAIAEYNRAIEANARLVAPHYNLGVIYLKKKMADQAIKEFTMVIILDHDYADAYLHRSKAYESKGDKVNAQNDYNSYQHAKSAFARVYKEEIVSPYYEGSNPAE